MEHVTQIQNKRQTIRKVVPLLFFGLLTPIIASANDAGLIVLWLPFLFVFMQIFFSILLIVSTIVFQQHKDNRRIRIITIILITTGTLIPPAIVLFVYLLAIYLSETFWTFCA